MERRNQLTRWFAILTFNLLLLVFVLTSASNSTHAKVSLSATDGAVPVPGGHVVPLNGSITLKCHATNGMFSSITLLQWNITGNISGLGSGGALSSSGQGKYSVPKGSRDNPTLLSIHNLQLNESGSTVLCGVPDNLGGYLASSRAKIVFVEGAPQCPNFNIANEVNSIIAWRYDDHVLLPVTYTISVRKLSGETVLSENTSQTQFELSGRDIPTLMNYTVTVLACTMAGCSQNCDYTWFSIPQKAVTISTSGTDTQETARPSGKTGIVVAVIACIVVGIGILVVVVIVSWCIVWKRKSKNDKHSVDGIVQAQTLKSSNDGVLEEYATVTDVVKSHHLHSPPDKSIPPSCSHHSNVTDTEGYGTVQNAAKSPQKVCNESRFKAKPTVPITSEYALVNHNTTNQTSAHVRPIAHGTRHSITGPIAVPSEYAQVPDSIKMKPPLLRTQSIPTPSSVSDGTFLPAPPPLPPRGSELSPESPDVIDAGYASLPHNNKSGKITKVRPSKRDSSRDV